MKRFQFLLFAFIALLYSGVIQGQQPVFLENFENGVIPENWTIYDMNNDFRVWETDSRNPHSGEWCVGVSANFDGTKNDWLITPLLLPTSENHTFSFWAKSQVPLPELYEDFKIRISVTDTEPDSFQVLIAEEFGIPAEWNEYVYDLSAYIGQEIYVAVINESIDKAVMFADDFTAPYFYFDNDLQITNIQGETMPVAGEQTEHSITVKNNGWLNQQDYEVNLLLEDGTVIAAVQGPSLDPFEETVITFQWVPEQVLSTSIYAEVVSANDENPENNRSKDWYISVHPTELLDISHGSFSEKEFSPLFFPAKTSLSETIYHAEDIGTLGYITEIAYSASFQYEVRNKAVRIWIGETDLEELNMTWIPSTELELVYDGEITIPKGDWMIPVKFVEPYQYTGGNLVIMVERSWDDHSYGFENTFHNSATETYQTIQYENNYEPTDPANPSLDPYWTASSTYAPDLHLYFDVTGMGSLSGLVTDHNATPVENVMISSQQLNLKIATGQDGTYAIPYIFEGDYNFITNKHGYYNSEGQVTIAENQAQTLNFEITPIPEVIVEGTIAGSDNPEEGIEGAYVKLEGYENYEVSTNSTGYFSFESVYTGNVYLLSVSAEGYAMYQMEVAVEGVNVDLGTLVLNELTPPPIKVTATDFDMMAGVSWIEPGGFPANEFRYDDGQIVSQLGFDGLFPNAVMGSAHQTNSVITSISWFLTDEEYHNTVKLFVFGLDETGIPDESVILYQSGEIPNTDNQWNEHQLPNYLDAPEGFFVGICTPNQFTSIGIDDGMDEPYAFNFGTHYIVDDWTAGNEWADIGDLGFMQNMMIRANGYSFGPVDKSGKEPDHLSLGSTPQLVKSTARIHSDPKEELKFTDNGKALESYQVFRLLKGDEANEDLWTTLSLNFSGTFYDDPMWSGVDPGIYRYAVKAVYTNGLLSPARFSNELEKEEKAEVNFTVNANSGDPVTGAVFLFEAEQGYPGYTYSTILNESGQVFLTSVPKDTYKVNISLDGFEDFYAENIVVECDTAFAFELTEIFDAPFNPLVETYGEPGTALFTWNNAPDAVIEDFEGLENFTTELGDWTSLNADGLNTTYINEFDYPLNGSDFGFAVFNPEATDPPMEDITAYSGVRCAAAVNADMAESNDWLISPKTEVVSGSEFSFMARSCSDMWELEWFRVGVSTTGMNPEDFTIISEGDFLVAPYWNWQEYSFDLSDYAGQEIYVAVQHISIDGYIFLLDDLYIGIPAPAQRALTGYTVYLDGEEVGTTDEESFVLNNLVGGQNYVAGVAANYTTGSSEIVTVEFTAENQVPVSERNRLQVNLYPNPSNGEFHISTGSTEETTIIIFDALGQKVYHQIINGQSGKIHLDKPQTGIYWVKLVQGTNTVTKKLVIR